MVTITTAPEVRRQGSEVSGSDDVRHQYQPHPPPTADQGIPTMPDQTTPTSEITNEQPTSMITYEQITPTPMVDQAPTPMVDQAPQQQQPQPPMDVTSPSLTATDPTLAHVFLPGVPPPYDPPPSAPPPGSATFAATPPSTLQQAPPTYDQMVGDVSRTGIHPLPPAQMAPPVIQVCIACACTYI